MSDFVNANFRPSNLSNYWFNRAESLNRSALILYESHGERAIELYDPCLLVAGLSLEVISKAILVKLHQSFDEKKYGHHRILEIIKLTNVEISSSQKATIQAFEESITWLSKYPEPKGGKRSPGKTRGLFKNVGKPSQFGQVITGDPAKWPNKKNYLLIWQKLTSAYWETPTENPSEFGYKLRGIDRPWE